MSRPERYFEISETPFWEAPGAEMVRYGTTGSDFLLILGPPKAPMEPKWSQDGSHGDKMGATREPRMLQDGGRSPGYQIVSEMEP